MQASVIQITNPFNPAAGKVVRTVRAHNAIAEYVPETYLPIVCFYNDKPLLRKDWPTTFLQDGDVLAFVAQPQGGGGGDSNKTLRTVALIALSIWAPGAGAGIAKYYGWSAAAGTLVAAGIYFAGAMLINAVLPYPRPSSSSQTSMGSDEGSSPTYSLSAQGNTARLGQPIPVQYGRHISYPDFAAAPYAEFFGNEQYLYQLLCIGQGDHEVEAIRIEDTPVENFGGDVEYEVVPPGVNASLFPVEVVASESVSGQEALTGVPLGPFTANRAGTDINFIGVDVVCPRGLYYAEDNGGFSPKSVVFQFEAREIDDSGAPLSGWSTLGGSSITLTSASSLQQRASYRFEVATGRYEVRMTRLDTKDLSSRAGHDLNWVGLRGYLPDTADYGDVTLLAVRLRASSNLSQTASRRINVIATRKLQYWDSTDWSALAVPTTSIAWAAADICRAAYGMKLTNAQINIDQLVALHTIWEARGDTINGRFDSTQSAWEALQQVLRTGRAKAFLQGGIVNFVRDQPQTVPAAMFTPRNTTRGSLNVDYAMPTTETADCVEVTYFDKNIWAAATVSAALGGSSSANPAKVQLFGVTDRDQAWREGMYMAACNRYRRKAISLSTELEGLIPSYGDTAVISSERLTRSQYGEVVSVSSDGLTAVLSEPVSFTSGEDNYIALRKRDGSMAGPYVVSPGIADNEVVFGTAPEFTLDTDNTRERTHFMFGTLLTYRQLAVVTNVKPTSGFEVAVSLIAETLDANGDPYVHQADTGVPPPPIDPRLLPRLVTTPAAVSGLTLSEELVQIGNNVRVRLNIFWTPSANAEGYRVAWRVTGGGNWINLPDQTASTASILDIPENVIEVRVTAFLGALQSGPATATINIAGRTARPADVTGFSVIASAGFAIASWTLHPDLDVRIGGNIVIRHSPLLTGALWTDGIILDSFPGQAINGQVPLIAGTYMAKAKDSSGQWSEVFTSWTTPEGMVSPFTTVETTIQDPDFTGAKSNVSTLYGTLRLDSASTVSGMTTLVSQWPKISALGGIQATGLYEFDTYIDMGTVAVRRYEADISVQSFDTGDYISFRGLVSQWSSVNGTEVDDCDATLYASNTDDDPAGTPTWGEWTPFFVADFNCRATKFKIELASGQQTHNIAIDTLRVDVKVPT